MRVERLRRALRAVRDYIRYDLREIVAPSSLPDPPGVKHKRLTLVQYWQVGLSVTATPLSAFQITCKQATLLFGLQTDLICRRRNKQHNSTGIRGSGTRKQSLRRQELGSLASHRAPTHQPARIWVRVPGGSCRRRYHCVLPTSLPCNSGYGIVQAQYCLAGLSLNALSGLGMHRRLAKSASVSFYLCTCSML